MHELLEKLNKTSVKLLEAKSTNELSKSILEEALKLTKINSGTILLNDNNKLIKNYSINVPFTFTVSAKDKIWKILKKHQIRIDDIGKYRAFKKNKTNFIKILFLPLTHHKEIIGILILFSKKQVLFSTKEISLLKIYLSTAGLTLKKIQLHSQMQNAIDMRDRFISLASHELRTPLTSLNGYVQLLHRKIGNNQKPESRWVNELYEETGRLTRLIKELLDINRIKEGQLEFIFTEVNIKELINKAIERFKFKHKENSVVFTDNTKEKDSIIIGDENKLLQMLSALLSNAAKFSPSNSKVYISLHATSRSLIIKVTDKGKGIPQSEVSKIFKGFYKIGKEEKQGMGVGLLLADHIIRYHRGRIDITSKENYGTAIEVQLPLIKMEY